MKTSQSFGVHFTIKKERAKDGVKYTVADARFCFLLSAEYNKPDSAPLLCAGLIGFRSYQMIDPKAKNIGMYGLGQLHIS